MEAHKAAETPQKFLSSTVKAPTSNPEGVKLYQDQKTHLGLSLPLPVGQDLSEGRPDVEAVQLEPRDQLLEDTQSANTSLQ